MEEKSGIDSYRRFLAGDKGGLEELVALYQRALLLFINGYVGDIALAEDIESDTFFELYKRKKPFSDDGGASFKTYLFKIARNKALNAVKKRNRRRETSLDAVSAGAGGEADEELLCEERARALHNALKKLPSDYREVLHLRYFEELSPENVAAATGRRKKQVYNLLARGRAALKEILLSEGFEYENV